MELSGRWVDKTKWVQFHDSSQLIACFFTQSRHGLLNVNDESAKDTRMLCLVTMYGCIRLYTSRYTNKVSGFAAQYCRIFGRSKTVIVVIKWTFEMFDNEYRP